MGIKVLDFNGDPLQVGDHVVFALSSRLAEGTVIRTGLVGFGQMVVVESTHTQGKTTLVQGEGTIKVSD